MISQVDLIQRAEPYDALRPELEIYMRNIRGVLCIQHPLVYSIMHDPKLNRLVNAQFEAKQKALEGARAEADWHSYVFLHERPYRSSALNQIARRLDGPGLWSLVGAVYIDTENLWQWEATLRRFLKKYPEGRTAFMSDEDQAAYAALPDELTIYRGYSQPRRKLGWSWSLDLERARWFAERWRSAGKVVSGICRKSDALGYLIGRGEDEIVIDPKLVYQEGLDK